MKKSRPIKETVEIQLEKIDKARRRGGLLRETTLLEFAWVPNVRKGLQYITEGLLQGAKAQPLNPKQLGESVRRAKLRAVGRELRHLQDFVEEVADETPQEDSGEEIPLDPADRRDCEWAAAQRREIMRLAARFERRMGPTPKVAPNPADEG